MSEDTSVNYVARAVESKLESVRTGLKWKRDGLADARDEHDRLFNDIKELEAQEAQLVSFLDYSKPR